MESVSRILPPDSHAVIFQPGDIPRSNGSLAEIA